MKKIKMLSPTKIICLGFLGTIVVGAILLYLPFTQNNGVTVSFTDAFFTSTSAVCVTGLIVVDTADTYNIIGQIVVAVLIQIGGLGITSIGVGFIIFAGKKIGFKERLIAKEALNYNSSKGILTLVKSVLKMTIIFEFAGAVLSFLVFSKKYKLLKAIWISIFHSVASFNNSGFDILGGGKNLIYYSDDVYLNIVTSLLIIFGGLGFLVIGEICQKHSFKAFSLHTKVVLIVTLTLIIVGTVMLKITDGEITWLQAYFTSVSARTAGFSTFPIGNLSNAGLLALTVLMFIGASPGSTGGGIKTSTFFVVAKSIICTAKNRPCQAFKRQIPKEIIKKAFTITVLALNVVIVSSFLLSICEPETNYMKFLFECVSAFGTVGLSTGITPDLTNFSKWVLIVTMYIGRLGPLTIASVWFSQRELLAKRIEEPVTIG